jgi:hypothetical protein
VYHFCTYFDRHYLARGLALYRSLARHCEEFQLYVLCLDEVTQTTLLKLSLPNIVAISLKELESADPPLLLTKQSRSTIEYYFTCTAPFLLHVHSRFPEIDVINYVDADLFFFANPDPIFRELVGHSILIIEHRLVHHLSYLETAGKYNVGFLSFRLDTNGLACLRWWRERCLEWCYDRVEGDRFADQRYLDDWPTRFDGVRVLQHDGAGLAPWNVGRYQLARLAGTLFVGTKPLIFYHFHQLRILSAFLFDPHLDNFGINLGGPLARYVYLPYARELQREMLRDSSIRQLGNVRGSAPPTARDLLRAFLHRRFLFVAGPVWANVYLGQRLGPLVRDLWATRRAFTRALRIS